MCWFMALMLSRGYVPTEKVGCSLPLFLSFSALEEGVPFPKEVPKRGLSEGPHLCTVGFAIHGNETSHGRMGCAFVYTHGKGLGREYNGMRLILFLLERAEPTQSAMKMLPMAYGQNNNEYMQPDT